MEPTPARRLVIDTATTACSVALFEGDKLIGHFHDVLGRGHAERLMPVIASLPDGGKASEILVDCGPGSFTGVRIGVAAAKGLGLAWGVPVRGYPVMALVDAGASLEIDGWRDAPRAIVMEGGHGEWFVRVMDKSGWGDIVSLTPDAAVAHIGALPVAGSRAQDLVALRGGGVALPLLPDARWATSLYADDLSAQVAPVYGRGADAKKMAG
ncbi:tRNA (adenosine(37)-N6)-threonylcarbamoyltransferase complex dimerization subunit type 1 TsaB [Pseudonocardia sp. TMWB2A]|uniref:tRNA (adenosine(37)-N6)-threonylcarbamoyltransferase complex dimerization subunit type 1 TsaB n=1 Tax=Pseudonocardia sp. TMWB2A TaxID=687430 RepID=UPI00307EEADD